MTTRHYGASEPPRRYERVRLRTLRDQHVLPDKGEHPSTDRMLETLDLIIDQDGGTRYELNKAADWLERLPLKWNAAQIEDWRSWPEDRAQRIADDVMLHGIGYGSVAVAHQTTYQTVEDIVRDRKRKIRRSL